MKPLTTASRSRRSFAARLGALSGALVLAALTFSILVSAATAAPVWEVKTRWGDAVLEPGAPGPVVPGEPGDGEFLLRVKNIGDSASEGTVTAVLELPPGVSRIPRTEFDEILQLEEGIGWICAGTTTVTCTRTDPVAPPDLSSPRTIAWHSGNGADGAPGFAPAIFIRVNVDPGASSGTAKLTVSGGGSAEPAVDVDQVPVGAGPLRFGVAPGSFEADVFEDQPPADGRVRQAGDHPFELRVDFDLNLRAGENESEFPGLVSPLSYMMPVGNLRTVEQTLPAGFIGNPEATPKCEIPDYQDTGASAYSSTECPPETQVGVLNLELNGWHSGTFNHGYGNVFAHPSVTKVPVYNLEPPKGVAADFGFNISGYRGHIYPTLDPASGYAIKATVPDISSILPVRQVEFTMWGVPADPAHDHLRALPRNQGGTMEHAYGASSSAPIRPLLSMPMSCGDHGGFKQRVDSWQEPGQWTPTEESSPSMVVTGCDDPRIRFEPKVELRPTSRAAGGPTGLQVNLKVPQRDQTVVDADDLYARNRNVHGVDTPPVKKAVVTMPEGMTISTSAAQGLGACTPAQLGLGTNEPVTCPDNSQYGTLTLRTPILPPDAPMTGQIYVAKQNDNPFNSFLALYLVIEDPERGLLVKIPGRVDLDPVTGQIKTTFDDLPQFPVSDMELRLKGGVRAALVNPTTCGTKTITAEFTPWSDPNNPVVSHSSYEIANKDNGLPCVKHLGERPFKPVMSAGTVSSSAGSYSPFAFRIERSDDDQEFSQLGVDLPKGLLAKLAGITKCPDAAIAAAEAPGRTGTEEATSASCPASSQIGTTDVGSGVGQVLTYVPGKAYLAGPYKGAPLSMVALTPILAGPYDLGVIAVRSAIHVNPETAQASVTTDPFPQIFKGIPVRIRDIRVKVDRADTMLNPTNCSQMEVRSRATGTGGDVASTADDTAADLAVPFQAFDCASLPFKPKLSFRLKGGTKRGDYPAMTATLKARRGDANIARTVVTLPHSEFLAQEHIRTVCTRVQFAADACPAGSIYGRARAVTPLFDQPLEGPVYLRANGGDRLIPDLVAALNGEVDVVLAGFIDAVDARIRTKFNIVPDAPVTKFTLAMRGGKKGLLVNSRNLCRARARADVKMVGQNGKLFGSRPVVVAERCKKSRKGRGAKKR